VGVRACCSRGGCFGGAPMTAQERLDREMAKLAAMGVTISTRPASGAREGFEDRPFGIIAAAARRAGISEDPETFWNGEPVEAIRGTVVVADTDVYPKYWARDLVGQRIPVVRVLDWYLDDRDGTAWAKVTDGRGSPRL